MLRRPLLTVLTALLALPALGLVTGCQSSGKAVGIRQVDDLLGRIERVHLEAELSRERAHSVMDGLRAVVAIESAEDVVETFATFSEALKDSEEQSYRLRAAIGPMKASADAVFERWSADLAEFSSVEMRRRSQARMDDTRARYEAIVAAVGPAVTSYEVLNSGLRDLSLFLGHDLNTTAIQTVGREVQILVDDAMDLNQKLQGVLVSCRDYVRAAAPAGTVETDGQQADAHEPTGTAKP